jgi:hypothetical protein
MTIVLTLALLPRVKGVFVAILWSLGMPTGVPDAGSSALPTTCIKR